MEFGRTWCRGSPRPTWYEVLPAPQRRNIGGLLHNCLRVRIRKLATCISCRPRHPAGCQITSHTFLAPYRRNSRARLHSGAPLPGVISSCALRSACRWWHVRLPTFSAPERRSCGKRHPRRRMRQQSLASSGFLKCRDRCKVAISNFQPEIALQELAERQATTRRTGTRSLEYCLLQPYIFGTEGAVEGRRLVSSVM